MQPEQARSATKRRMLTPIRQFDPPGVEGPQAAKSPTVRGQHGRAPGYEATIKRDFIQSSISNASENSDGHVQFWSDLCAC
jgi:hypothetical protein